MIKELESQLKSIIESTVTETVQGCISNLVQTGQLQKIIEHALTSSAVEVSLDYRLKTAIKEYLQHSGVSVSAKDVNWQGFKFSPNMIGEGVIDTFASTGITDEASQTQFCVMDHATVVENRLVAKQLDVMDRLEVKNITVTGNINTDIPAFQMMRDEIKQEAWLQMAQLVDSLKTSFVSIKEDALYLGNKPLMTTNSLSPAIQNSNLRSVGILKELVVAGEVDMADTLFVGKGKRVGINTTEPSHALDIWDEEVKLSFGKQSKNTAMISVQRGNKLVFEVNDGVPLSIDSDGNVCVESVKLNNRTWKYGQPNHSGTKGDIVWNDNPQIGQPIGWVCMSGTNWAGFGEIK